MMVPSDLRPELAATEVEEAAARGLDLKEPPPTSPELGTLALAEFDRIMDEFAESSDGLAVPPVAGRAAIYNDHD